MAKIQAVVLPGVVSVFDMDAAEFKTKLKSMYITDIEGWNIGTHAIVSWIEVADPSVDEPTVLRFDEEDGA